MKPLLNTIHLIFFIDFSIMIYPINFISIGYTKPLVHSRSIKFIIMTYTDIIIHYIYQTHYLTFRIYQKAESPGPQNHLPNSNNFHSKFSIPIHYS